MRGVGFSDGTQHTIMRLVAAVLWLGNIGFGTGGAKGACRVNDPAAALAVAAELLGVAPAALEGALTHRTITMQGGHESIRTPFESAAECTETAQASANHHSKTLTL